MVVVDLRRKRWLDRSRLALQIAAAQLFVLGAAVGAAILLAGWSWFVPVVVAAPLVAVEMSFEIRSRARKLMPELCGAIAVAAVAGSIVIAAGRSSGLAAGVWLVLAARATGAIPFVRVQILFEAAHVNWNAHIATLIDFWCWQLLGEPGYDGQPLRAHEAVNARTPLVDAHYTRWVELFCDTVDATFNGPCAEIAKGRGRKMAVAMQRPLAGVSASGAAPIEPTWRRTEASVDDV